MRHGYSFSVINAIFHQRWVPWIMTAEREKRCQHHKEPLNAIVLEHGCHKLLQKISTGYYNNYNRKNLL